MKPAEVHIAKVAPSRRRIESRQPCAAAAPKQAKNCSRKQPEREWGETARAGAKPDWYQKLFHR